MKRITRTRSSLARQAGIVALFVIAAVLGILTGGLVAYTGDLPLVEALDDYTPSTITRVHASSGEVVGEFATQRRILLRYEDIPELLRHAILSAEDDSFEHHIGINFRRLFVAAVTNVLKGGYEGGASTLTQQLARKLFLKPDKTLERKVKEWLLALQIEKRYTKQEIFTLYCNQMNLGHGAYGVEAAARLYFGKSVKDLKLEEAATIAGILQLPERQSPYVNPTWATRRRNYALQRMATEGYITRAEADAAAARPLAVTGLPAAGGTVAPYFIEEVRKHLERQYGARDLYESGLEVYTTLDVELQQAANLALDRGLRAIDKRRGYRRPSRSVLGDGGTIASYTDRRWERPIRPGDIVPAVVVRVGGTRRADASAGLDRPLPQGAARLRVGTYEADLTRRGFAWTGRSSAADLVGAGDLIQVAVTGVDEQRLVLEVTLEQEPVIDGALLAIDNDTGQIMAMTGGLDFRRSKFNRAVQAPRQVGSIFKPVVFAAAIDRGYTPSTIIVDEPVSYEAGPGQPPYEPRNYDRRYEGPITIRRVIEQSRNVPTVRMMDQLGPAQVVEFARRLGFESPLQPFLSTALGASEATLLEVTSAYSAFANQGLRMQPYQISKIVDRDGTLLEEQRPEARDGIRADTAYIISNLLRGVVERGTAEKAAALEWPLAGKTGTVDDYTDAWFVGFDPHVTVGVWVGFDEKKPIGPNETGAAAALPIWIDFMQAYIGARGDRNAPPRFEAPGNIVQIAIDRASGRPVPPETPGSFREAYIAGTQPGVEFPRQPGL
ncbi:MAG: PBP1A family penicillin-binding protein [Acidobacteriota bacterium]